MIKKNTKMKWAVLIFLVLIASLLTWRIYYVNQNVPKVQTEYYDVVIVEINLAGLKEKLADGPS